MTAPTRDLVHPHVGRAAVGLGAVLFGTSATAAGRWSPTLDGMSLASWRLVVGGTALVVLSMAVGRAPWRYQLTLRAVVVGGVTVVGFQVCYFAAVERLGVAQATMLTIATSPVAAALVDHLRGRALITMRWVGGSLVAVLGIAVLSSGTWVIDLPGWTLAALAGTGFPIYGSVIGSLASDRPRLTAVATVFGAAVPLAVVVLLTNGGAQLRAGGEVLTVGYLGLIATAAAYYTWSLGLQVLPVRDTVLITMVEPITATLLAWAFLHESLSPIGVIAIAAILTGITIAATARPGVRVPADEQSLHASPQAAGRVPVCGARLRG